MKKYPSFSEREHALWISRGSLKLAEIPTTMSLSVQQAMFEYGCDLIQNQTGGHDSVCRVVLDNNLYRVK
jgi:hypothetical protein